MQIRYWVILIVIIVAFIMINISFALGLNGDHHPGGVEGNPDPTHMPETRLDICLCCKRDPEQLKLPDCQSDLASESKCKDIDYNAKCCQ